MGVRVHVAVDVHGHLQGAVTDDLHHGPRVDALSKLERHTGVSVPCVPDTCPEVVAATREDVPVPSSAGTRPRRSGGAAMGGLGAG